MKTQYKDIAIRVARTFGQTFIGVFMTGLLANEVTSLAAFANIGLLDSAAAAGMVAILSLLQNSLENLGSVQYSRG